MADEVVIEVVFDLNGFLRGPRGRHKRLACGMTLDGDTVERAVLHWRTREAAEIGDRFAQMEVLEKAARREDLTELLGKALARMLMMQFEALSERLAKTPRTAEEARLTD